MEKITAVIANFLGNHRAENYKELVRDMIKSLHLIGVNMSLKIHFLNDHLDDFPSNCGVYNDEEGERFHQEIKTLESR